MFVNLMFGEGVAFQASLGICCERTIFTRQSYFVNCMFGTQMVFQTLFVETLHTADITKLLLVILELMSLARYFKVETFTAQIT